MNENIKELERLASPCRLCPRKCLAHRADGEKGYCKAGMDLEFSSWNLHFGEEPPISGLAGSGAIFLSKCALGCVFCQNYPISHLGNGSIVSVSRASEIMLELEAKGAHNINFVTPTHFAHRIARAVEMAREKGLAIPIVYNSSGYESVETVRLLSDLVDIYMPDMKYGENEKAYKVSNVRDYVETARAAIKEMYSARGPLVMNKDGIAYSGVIIRHLVLPDNYSSSEKVLDYIKEDVGKDAYISLMSQYHPAYRGTEMPGFCRTLKKTEYSRIKRYCLKLGFENGFFQDL